LRGVLRYARMFDLLQRVLGFPYQYAADEITAQIPPREGALANEQAVVLDVGCGTARVLQYLDGIRYIGLEPSPKYVAAARTRFPDTEFLPMAFQDIEMDDYRGRVDVVVAIGVLHHVPDPDVVGLAGIASEVLRPGGAFVTLDPAFVAGQHRLARTLSWSDRGEHVRTPAHLSSLIAQVFPNIDTEVRHDLRKFPYTHVVIRAKG
jgi:SAM-dependent methyltransferase